MIIFVIIYCQIFSSREKGNYSYNFPIKQQENPLTTIQESFLDKTFFFEKEAETFVLNFRCKKSTENFNLQVVLISFKFDGNFLLKEFNLFKKLNSNDLAIKFQYKEVRFKERNSSTLVFDDLRLCIENTKLNLKLQSNKQLQETEQWSTAIAELEFQKNKAETLSTDGTYFLEVSVEYLRIKYRTFVVNRVLRIYGVFSPVNNQDSMCSSEKEGGFELDHLKPDNIEKDCYNWEFTNNELAFGVKFRKFPKEGEQLIEVCVKDKEKNFPISFPTAPTLSVVGTTAFQAKKTKGGKTYYFVFPKFRVEQKHVDFRAVFVYLVVIKKPSQKLPRLNLFRQVFFRDTTKLTFSHKENKREIYLDLDLKRTEKCKVVIMLNSVKVDSFKEPKDINWFFNPFETLTLDTVDSETDNIVASYRSLFDENRLLNKINGVDVLPDDTIYKEKVSETITNESKNKLVKSGIVKKTRKKLKPFFHTKDFVMIMVFVFALVLIVLFVYYYYFYDR